MNDFLIAFQQTGMKPFLKIHIVSNVPECLSILDSICPFKNPGLAWTGEQAMESSHHHYNEVWQRLKRSPKSENALLLAVIDFIREVSYQLLRLSF